MKRDTVIGSSLIRPDALAKVQGRAPYVADIKLEKRDCLIGRALFPPYAHAKILSIDTSRAEALSGVEVVMTAKDLPGLNGYGAAALDKPVLADKIVRYQGDPVAFVAACDKKTADKAVALIEVKYEPLFPQTDPKENLKPETPLIHEDHPMSKGTNISSSWRVERGNVIAALSRSDIVLENDFETQIVDHAYLETDSCIAEPDPVTGILHLITQGHSAQLNCRSLAAAFGLPHSKVHVTIPIVGGSFGGKEDSNLEVSVMAGVLALKTGKSVFCEYTREESFRNTGKRHATHSHRKLGATKEGILTAVAADITVNKGAYRSIDPIPQRMTMYGGGVYRVPNALVEARSVFTNQVYGCACRGLGVPQAMFIIESQMDDLARRLNMDPVELRLKNILRDGDTMITGQTIKKSQGLGLEKCIQAVCERIGWDKPLEQSDDPSIRRGRGIATIMYGTGTGYPTDGAHCFLNLQMDGSLMVGIATAELGQGGIIAMTQIASEAMGIPYNMVSVNYSDNHSSPEAGATVASRSTVFHGNAIINGCNILKDRMLCCAGQILGEDPRDLDIREGIVYTRQNKERSIPLTEAIKFAFSSQVPLTTTGSWYPPLNHLDPIMGQDTRMHTYTYGAQAVEVSVDTGTGIYTLDRCVSAFDVGKAINPMCVEGQIEGGVTQGIGYAMMEKVELKNAMAVTDTYHTYLIPTSMDLPKLETILVEEPNELGPFGAKGIGEPPVTAAAPAIRNALLDAIDIPFYSLPITPIDVLDAIKKKEKSCSK